MKKFIVLIVSLIILTVSVVLLSGIISAKLGAYKAKKEQIAEELSFENRLMTPWEWIPGSTVGEGKVEVWRKLELEAQAKYNGALFYGGVLAIVIFLFVGINFLAGKNKENQYQIYGLTVIFAALSFLYLGLQSPLLEIHAYNKDLAFEVPIDVDFDEMDYIGSLGLGEFKYDFEQTFEGRTYYLYQNKSIFQLIGLLYTGGNFLIAIILILFSVVFPLFKLIASVILLLNPSKPSNANLYKVVKNLGKWSMADVFVSAIFLAIFSFSNMNAGVDTGSTTLVGSYFFLAFVVISISSGKYLKKAMNYANGAPIDQDIISDQN